MDKTEWLRRKAQDPKFLPALLESLEREKSKAILELRKQERSGTLDQIRYFKGQEDGIATIFAVIDGMMVSETKKPVLPGLVASILKFGERNGT
jgi:hypothetical protein